MGNDGHYAHCPYVNIGLSTDAKNIYLYTRRTFLSLPSSKVCTHVFPYSLLRSLLHDIAHKAHEEIYTIFSFLLSFLEFYEMSGH